jgi:DNA-binding XRE family transcriptional regulator
MSTPDINIYAACRRRTGLTQEAWAETVGISVESVKRYESGERVPNNYIVLQMICASGDEGLAYRHLMNTSRHLDVLPEAETGVPLPQAAISLINRVLDFADQHRHRQLLRIAEDGVVSAEERPLYNDILDELHEIVAAAYQVRYADERGEIRL